MNMPKKDEKKITQKTLMKEKLRRCSYTKKVLPLTEFNLLKNGKYDSLSKEGRALYQKDYRKKNPERKKMHDKIYREKVKAMKEKQNEE